MSSASPLVRCAREIELGMVYQLGAPVILPCRDAVVSQSVSLLIRGDHAMSTTLAHPLSPVRRRVVTAALAAAIGPGGAGAVVAATHESGSTSGQPAAQRVLRDTDGMCWYKGWFEEDGVWYQGYFKEAC
jgi:hypothetical protein